MYKITDRQTNNGDFGFATTEQEAQFFISEMENEDMHNNEYTADYYQYIKI